MGEQLLKSSANFTAGFDQLLKEDNFVDCSLAAEGGTLKAHRAVLSAASAYFELLLNEEPERNPVIIFTDIRFNELEAVLRFIYRGEVVISEDRLSEFLNLLTFLQFKGLDCNELEVMKTNVLTCENTNSFIAFEATTRQESSSFCEKGEREFSVEESVDNEHILQQYLHLDESSPTKLASDYGRNVSSIPPCEVKSDSGDCENSFSCSTSEPSFGHELSSLVTNIEIKNEEINFNVKIEKDDMAISEDEPTLEDANDHNVRAVFPGQVDAKLQIEDNVVRCESAVLRVGNEGTIKSPSCDIETTKETFYNQHKRTHLLEMPSQLPHCTLYSMQSGATNNGEFQNRRGVPLKCTGTAALEKESASTNYNEKPFKCTQCTYACNHKPNLIRHMRNHTGEKPFKCSQCSYACSQKTSLTNHIRKHTGEKPFKCMQCTFACNVKSGLLTHMRKHTGEKPFKCSQCTYACSEKYSLIKHMSTHSGEDPFKCPQCAYASSHKQNFIKHMRTHTGEKPFKCSQCTFASSCKSSLNTHLRTHTGEKPFKCSQCVFACSVRANLRRHIRTHTGGNPLMSSQ